MNNILIVDDHPLISDSFVKAFRKIEKSTVEGYKFSIQLAGDCDSALEKINNYSKNLPIDLVMLDIKLPPSQDGKYTSGEDLGIILNKKFPNCKIIICTTYNDSYRIFNLIKSINPDGLISKSDITNDELVDAILTVLEKPPYYSHAVRLVMRNQLSFGYHLDDIDRHLLYQISLGTRTIDLPQELPLEIAAIEIRKRRLKEIFDAVGKSDKVLIQNARKKGFL